MKVVLNYRMSMDAQNEQCLKSFFEALDKEVSVDDGIMYAYGNEENFTAEEDAGDAYLKKALEDCKKLHEVLLGDCELEGTIDTSETSGEYMDFSIKVEGDEISVSCSEWYLEVCMEDYEDYEDFCDDFFECSEEEFEEAKENEYAYILETEDGEELVDEVPLHPITL